jgi:hypothetical protein
MGLCSPVLSASSVIKRAMTGASSGWADRISAVMVFSHFNELDLKKFYTTLGW